jgi:hypothetical protein
MTTWGPVTIVSEAGGHFRGHLSMKLKNFLLTLIILTSFLVYVASARQLNLLGIASLWNPSKNGMLIFLFKQK